MADDRDPPDERKERMVSFTIAEEDLARLMDWCRHYGLQRARGIRTLIRFGLEHRAVPDDEPDLRTREQRELRRKDDDHLHRSRDGHRRRLGDRRS